MTSLLLALVVALAWVAREWRVRHRLRAMECVWRFAVGWLSVDLRRQALLVRFENDLQEFPQPREIRELTLRLADLPLWSCHCVVALPYEIDARIDRVRAGEFDHLFSRRFRLERAAPSLRGLLRA